MIEGDNGPISELIETVLIRPLELCFKLGAALFRRKPEPPEKTVWVPKTETERAVLAALILAGKPVTNDELADLMGVSKSEASKRVTALDGYVRKVRKGRAVEISLH